MTDEEIIDGLRHRIRQARSMGSYVNYHMFPIDWVEALIDRLVRSSVPVRASGEPQGDPLLRTRWREKDRRLQRIVVVVGVNGSKVSYRNEATGRLAVSNLTRFQHAYTQLPELAATTSPSDDGARQPQEPSVPVQPEAGVAVAGRMERSIADFIRACGVHLVAEQENVSPNNALIGTLCEGVRMAREYLEALRSASLWEPDYEQALAALPDSLGRPLAIRIGGVLDSLRRESKICCELRRELDGGIERDAKAIEDQWPEAAKFLRSHVHIEDGV